VEREEWLVFLFGHKDDSNSRYLIAWFEMSETQKSSNGMGPWFDKIHAQGIGAGQEAGNQNRNKTSKQIA